MTISTKSTYFINGTAGNDTLKGTAEDEIIFGRLGNDRLLGGKGNDQLFGGSGDDVIDGGKGNDYIQGSSAPQYEDATGNDHVHIFGAQGRSAQYDELTGGAGADAFVMTDEDGNQSYLNDDDLATSGSKGFALVKDFEVSLNSPKDTIVLDGFASHYRLMGVSWGQEFGKANTSKFTDVAVVYIGAEQDKQDVVAVLQDVSAKFLTNSSGYLNNDNVFTFLG